MRATLALLALLPFTACGDDDACQASADTCPGDTICMQGACVPAFDRTYRVSALAVTMPPNHNGDAWDADGSQPDPFLAVTFNGTEVLSTTPVQDSAGATFPDTVDLTVAEGAALVVAAYDDDLTTPDPGPSCEAAPLTAALLRARQLGCDGTGWAVSFTIAPR